MIIAILFTEYGLKLKMHHFAEVSRESVSYQSRKCVKIMWNLFTQKSTEYCITSLLMLSVK